MKPNFSPEITRLRSHSDYDTEVGRDAPKYSTATPATDTMTDHLRQSALGNVYYRIMQNTLLPWIQDSGITPNQMTLIGVLAALGVPLGFYLHPTLGWILIVISGIADSLDGLLARRAAKCTIFGAFLDSSLDRLSDCFYLIGFWSLFLHQPGQVTATLIVFTALLFTFLISYVKARAESLGAACGTGLMERGVRVVYLIAWALALVVFGVPKIVLWGGLLVYWILTLATVVQRIRHVRQKLQTTSAGCSPV